MLDPPSGGLILEVSWKLWGVNTPYGGVDNSLSHRPTGFGGWVKASKAVTHASRIHLLNNRSPLYLLILRNIGRIPFRHSRDTKVDCRQSTYSYHLLLSQWNTSFHLLYPSPDFISVCVIPAIFSSPAIPYICKILKLCPFGILS